MTLRELLFWYRIYEREVVQENILNEFAENKKPIPTQQELRRRVDKELKRRKENG